MTDPVSAIAALDEPTRRRLYEYVSASATPVGRDEAAKNLGIARATAAFHLDRLADEGLLQTTLERLTGRTGPGAGRPAKLYQRSDREFDISLPGRRYDIAGELLAAALEEAQTSGAAPRDVLATHAHELGVQLGRAATASDPIDVLGDYGFEPRLDDGNVRLGNCPFHRLAQAHTELVCGMNLHLLEGVLDGLGDTSRAVLSPSEGHCCVVLRA